MAAGLVSPFDYVGYPVGAVPATATVGLFSPWDYAGYPVGFDATDPWRMFNVQSNIKTTINVTSVLDE